MAEDCGVLVEGGREGEGLKREVEEFYTVENYMLSWVGEILV